MKTKFKNCKMFAIITLLLMIIASAIMGLNFNSNVASATSHDFSMVLGSSLKINEDGGMRFRTEMDSETRNYIVENENVNLYFIVTTEKHFNSVEDGKYYETLSEEGKGIIIPVEESKIYQIGEKFYANGCTINMKAESRNQDRVCIASIETINGSQKTYEYAKVGGLSVDNQDFSIKNAGGNFYNLVKSAVLDNEKDYSKAIFESSAYDWFGTEEYPLNINKISEYESLVVKINGGQSFTNKVIKINDVDTETSTEQLDPDKSLPSTAASYYKVTFCNEDGSVIEMVSVKEGTTAVNTITPSKSQSETEVYSFDKWLVSVGGLEADLTNVDESFSVYASFKSSPRPYDITWKDYKGDTIAVTSCDYGTIPTFDGTPDDWADENGAYKFKEWTPALEDVTGEATYTATYERKPDCEFSTISGGSGATYTDAEEENIPLGASYATVVNYPNYGGGGYVFKLRLNRLFEQGETYKYTVRLKEIDVSYWYSFKVDWNGGINYLTEFDFGLNQSSNAVKESGHVKYLVATENSIYKDLSINIHEPQAGEKDIVFAVSVEVEHITYHTVTWQDYDGTVLETDENVEVGTMPEFNGELPTDYVEDGEVYGFLSWSPEVSAVTGNVVYTAIYGKKPKQELSSVNTGEKAVYYDADGEQIPTGASYATVVDYPSFGASYVINVRLYGVFEAGETYKYTIRFKELITHSHYYDFKIDFNGGSSYTQAFSFGLWQSDSAAETEGGYVKDIVATENAFYKDLRVQIYLDKNNAYDLKFAVSVEVEHITYHTVTWKDHDGTVLETDENVEVGTMPEFNGELPTDYVENGEVYGFLSWSPEVSAVTGDVVYTAIYGKKPKQELSTRAGGSANLTYTDADSDSLPLGASYATVIDFAGYPGSGYVFNLRLNAHFEAGATYRYTIRIKEISVPYWYSFKVDWNGGSSYVTEFDFGLYQSNNAKTESGHSKEFVATENALYKDIAINIHEPGAGARDLKFAVSIEVEKVADAAE